MHWLDSILSRFRHKDHEAGEAYDPIHNSTLIRAIGYSEKNQDLTVEFQNGAVYVFRNVPKHFYDEMKRINRRGGSVGAYFSEKVRKGPYKFTRVQ